MKVVFEKKLIFEAKAKLIRLYSNLTDQDFDFKEGGEQRMMERIRIKLGLPRTFFYTQLGLYQEDYEHKMI